MSRPLPGPPPSAAAGTAWHVKLLAGVLGLALAPVLMGTPEGQRGLLALCLLGLFFILLIYSPRAGIPWTLAYLAALGGLRRWLIPIFGWTPMDPLLLVSPALVMLYDANLLARRGLPARTRLSRLLVCLLALMTLEILNPLQGGLAIGVAGALFYIVPLLWYFVGRCVGDAALVRRLIRVAIGIGILAALYGLYQTWFGYSAGEQEWLRLSGYTALNVGGTIRAISFFTSSAEYAHFLCVALVLLWALWLRGHRLVLLPMPLLALAIFLESSRGVVFSVLAACAALWAVQGRRTVAWLPRGLLAAGLAVTGLVWSLGRVQQGEYGVQTQALIEHQASGLLNPLDERHSTATQHSTMALDGVKAGFTDPLGQGLGATTLAAAKFNSAGGSTEVDVSNMFVSLGFAGGLLYVAIIGVVLMTAFRYWHRARNLAALAILGLLLLELGQWLTGGHYAASMLIWFCIGALDRLQPERETAS
ncbi:MAG: hypothetical protein JO250_17555 [Armatimonadetes bacterium]|nr:hypothetical protein [Armatimonadota bacterium]